MKICIVGNSHAGALKRALTRIDLSSDSFDFFVQTGGNGPRLEVRNGRIFTIGGHARPERATFGDFKDGIDLTAYDAILFASAGLASHAARAPNHPLNNMLHAGYAERRLPGLQSVSGAVMSLALESCLLALPQMQAIRTIRSVFSGPLVIVTRPLPARSFDTSPAPSDLPAKYGNRLPAFMTWYYREQIRIISNVARPLGAACLPPPEEFMLAGFTPERFCPRDPWHTNADYGEITLHAALQLLRQGPAA